jgi:hypothetical protein
VTVARKRRAAAPARDNITRPRDRNIHRPPAPVDAGGRVSRPSQTAAKKECDSAAGKVRTTLRFVVIAHSPTPLRDVSAAAHPFCCTCANAVRSLVREGMRGIFGMLKR